MLKEDTYVSERAAHQAIPMEGWFFLAGAAILSLSYIYNWSIPAKFFGLMWVLFGVIPLMGEIK